MQVVVESGSQVFAYDALPLTFPCSEFDLVALKIFN